MQLLAGQQEEACTRRTIKRESLQNTSLSLLLTGQRIETVHMELQKSYPYTEYNTCIYSLASEQILESRNCKGIFLQSMNSITIHRPVKSYDAHGSVKDIHLYRI